MPADLTPVARRTAHLLAATAVVYGAAAVAIACWLGAHAQPPVGSMDPDRAVYLAIAQDPFGGDPQAKLAPWAWRIGAPLVVYTLGLAPDTGFRVLTLASLAVCPGIMMLLLRGIGVSPTTTMLVGGMAVVMPPITGYLSWAYAMTDAFALVLMAGAAWATVTGRALPLTLFAGALALTKETWLLAVAFAFLWTRSRHALKMSRVVAAAALAATLAAIVRVCIEPANHYSIAATFAGLYLPLSAVNLLRRLMLATAATWNVLTPILAFSLARRWISPDGLALTIPILLAMLQPLLATETMRPVAAAYPFVFAACGLEMDRWPARTRLAVALACIAGQIPWLVDYAYVVRLPLRPVHIALGLSAALAIVWRTRTRVIEDRLSRPAQS